MPAHFDLMVELRPSVGGLSRAMMTPATALALGTLARYRQLLEDAALELRLCIADLDAAYHDDTSKGAKKVLHNIRRELDK